MSGIHPFVCWHLLFVRRQIQLRCQGRSLMLVVMLFLCLSPFISSH